MTLGDALVFIVLLFLELGAAGVELFVTGVKLAVGVGLIAAAGLLVYWVVAKSRVWRERAG